MVRHVQLDLVRTPDERFKYMGVSSLKPKHLAGWSYVPNYIDDLPGYEGLRMHYVDGC